MASPGDPPSDDEHVAFPWPLCVRVCTWNLAGKPIHEQDDLAQLLAPEGDAAHVCVIGTQELVELSMGNIFLGTDGEEQKSQAAFEVRVVQELEKTKYPYTKVDGVGMVGLFLLVYVRTELIKKVKEVHVDKVKTGMLHFAGNKGAVCVRFNLLDINYCFINVHLHHGQENQAARDQDISDTLRCAFQGSAKTALQPKADNHDVTVIFGDFNFRLNIEMSEADVERAAQFVSEKPLEFLERDQFLAGDMSNLSDFREGGISFEPTYKYRAGTGQFDTKRIPAWCDRILFKVNKDSYSLAVGKYSSLPALCHTSDHMPVVAILKVQPKGHIKAIPTVRRSRQDWLSHSKEPQGCVAVCAISCFRCFLAVASELISCINPQEPVPVHRPRAVEESVPIRSPASSPATLSATSPASTRSTPKKKGGPTNLVTAGLKATQKIAKKGLQTLKFDGTSPDARRHPEANQEPPRQVVPPLPPPRNTEVRRQQQGGQPHWRYGAKPAGQNL